MSSPMLRTKTDEKIDETFAALVQPVELELDVKKHGVDMDECPIGGNHDWQISSGQSMYCTKCAATKIR